MTIGEKIAYYRKKKQLTQKKLGEISGISEISIRKYEGGSRQPKLNQIQKIASALSVSDSIFVDTNKEVVPMDTTGDFMKSYFELQEKIDIKLVTVKEEYNDGNIVEKTAVIFDHPKLLENFKQLQLYQTYIETETSKLRSDEPSEKQQEDWKNLSEESQLLQFLMKKRMREQEDKLLISESDTEKQ